MLKTFSNWWKSQYWQRPAILNLGYASNSKGYIKWCFSILKYKVFLIHQYLQIPKVWEPQLRPIVEIVETTLCWTPRAVFAKRFKRNRSFDRITFFQNLLVILLKFVSVEKTRSFKFSPPLNILSNDVLSQFRKNKIGRKKRNLYLSISSLVGKVRLE